MEILTLKLFVAEDEINDVLRRSLPPDLALKNLKVRLTPEGIAVSGEYPLLIMMAFETLWEVTAAGGAVQARLASIKVSGLPAGKLRGVLLKSIRDVAAQHPGVWIENEAVCVDVEQVTKAKGFPVKVRLSAVRCATGSLVIEAEPPLV